MIRDSQRQQMMQVLNNKTDVNRGSRLLGIFDHRALFPFYFVYSRGGYPPDRSDPAPSTTLYTSNVSMLCAGVESQKPQVLDQVGDISDLGLT